MEKGFSVFLWFFNKGWGSFQKMLSHDAQNDSVGVQSEGGCHAELVEAS